MEVPDSAHSVALETAAHETQRHVAVVAVHGVADQKPGNTVRDVVRLLVALPGKLPGDPRPYSAATEVTQTIAVTPIPVTPIAPPPKRPWTPQNEFKSAYLQYCQSMPGRKVLGSLHDDIVFTKNLLGSYKPELGEQSYTTTVASVHRAVHGAHPPTSVDIFELYWADLSRPGPGLRRFVSEFYQLLFHLGSLGRLTIDAATVPHEGKPAWQTVRIGTAVAARMLAQPIALLNLALAALALVAVAVMLPEGWHSALVAGIVGAAVAVGICIPGYRSPTGVSRAVPVLAIAIGSGVAWAVWAGVLLPPSLAPPRGLALLAAVAGTALFWWFCTKHEARNPNAKWWGALACALMLLPLLFALFGGDNSKADVIGSVLWAAQWLLLGLILVWAVFFVAQAAAWLAGLWLRLGTLSHADRRALTTGRIAIALPALLFILLTLLLWLAVAEVGARYLPIAPYQFKGLICTSLLSCAQDMLDRSAVYADPVVWSLGGALIFAVFGFLPAVIQEILPRGADRQATERSQRLGRWLTMAFELLGVSAFVIYVGVVVLIPLIGTASNLDTGWVLFDRLKDWTEQPSALKAIAVIIAGSSVTLLALGSRLGKVFLGFRPVLDVALDVDNHLREHPLERNPRSQILTRYASLLRHLCAPSANRDRGYDAVVIVAHSQGSVITADLLRYVHHVGVPGLECLGRRRLPLRLLTVGCPLRQLYSQRFPNLYDWARHGHAGWPPAVPDIPAGQAPEPSLLRVTCWSNGYRSGDYVGRYLWRNEACADRWTPTAASKDTADTRREFCVGVGAHTHYFDGSDGKDPVAEELDRLITQ